MFLGTLTFPYATCWPLAVTTQLPFMGGSLCARPCARPFPWANPSRLLHGPVPWELSVPWFCSPGGQDLEPGHLPPPTPPTAPAVTPPGLNRAAPPSQALCKGLLGITVLLPLSFPPPFIQQLLIESLPCATYRQLNRNKKRRKSKMQFSPCNLQMRGLRPEEVTCSGSPSKSGAGSWL